MKNIKPNCTFSKITLRFFCVILFACMLVASTSLQTDLKYHEGNSQLYNNQVRVELLNNQFNTVIPLTASKENTSQYDCFSVSFIISASQNTELLIDLVAHLEAHLTNCFKFVSASKATYLKYLHHQSQLPSPEKIR